MGSDLYLAIDNQYANGHWSAVIDTHASAVDRGIVVDAFGDTDKETDVGRLPGYMTHDEWLEMQKHPECPWRLDEPYWVRLLDGAEFVAIVREKRWQKLQDGDFADRELLAAPARVGGDGAVPVRVWLWHSQ